MDFLAAANAAAEQLDWMDFAWIAFSVAVFTYLVRRLLRPAGDAVDVSHYGRVETGLAIALTCWFIMQGTAQFLLAPSTEKIQLTLRDLLVYELMIVVFTTVVVATIKSKGGNLGLLFGLGRQPLWKAFAIGCVLIFAAVPIVAAGMQLTQLFAKGPDDLQEIVKFFQAAGRERERVAVVVSAVIIAPISEELFFRGVIYGVTKKYGGLLAAIIFNASLFAFIHGSLPAFGGLFALAVCLTLAYEVSGSLYVPIVMHACFNAAQLAQMFFDPSTPKPHS